MLLQTPPLALAMPAITRYISSPAPLNTWNPAVITKAGTTVTMYLNDQVVTNAPIGRSIPTSAQFITIGRSDVAVYSGAWAFHGIIDDVRIYNVALSSNQVQQLYAFESQPIVSLKKAVKPAFANLFLGTNYQLQVSTDLSTWTNSGSAFTATNTSMVYPQYFDVDDWQPAFLQAPSWPVAGRQMPTATGCAYNAMAPPILLRRMTLFYRHHERLLPCSTPRPRARTCCAG